MAEVLIFFVGLFVVTWGLRFTALKMHRKNHPQQVHSEVAADEGDLPEDEEIIAVLAAAATAALKRRIVLRRVRFLQHSGGSAWSVTGRLNVMGSHLITKKEG